MVVLSPQKVVFSPISSIVFFELGFTPCKAEQPLRGIKLQEKEAQKDFSIHEICLERTLLNCRSFYKCI